MKGDFDFPANEWKGVSDAAKDLVRKLLCVDPQQRISVDELVQHSWLASSCVPASELHSPGVMLDRESFEQTKAIHSEFLQGMRGTEDSGGFFLKPIVKSKNRLLVNRQKVNGTVADAAAGAGAEVINGQHISPAAAPTGGEVNSEEGLISFKQLRDYCLMPPPPSLTASNLDDPVLVEGVKRCLTFNEKHQDPFIKMLQVEGWNGNEFVSSVNRQRLANAIQQFLESTSSNNS